MKVTPAVSVLGCLVLFVGSRGAAQQASANSPGKASRNITAKTGQATATAGCQPSVAALKKIANDEWAASHDRDRVLAAVDEAIGPDADDPWMFVSTGDNGLLFTVAFPARQYRYSLSEVLRKRESITGASAGSAVVIDVTATRIDDPNIEKVIVERNGKVIPPLSNSLAPHVMATRIGAREVINSGRLTYPCSAFLPGARVTVTGIPTSGGNLVLSLGDDQLETLSGREFPRPLIAGGLVGLSTDRVRKLLGETATETPRRLGYDINNGERLFLTTKGDAIAAVSDEKVLIADIKPPTKVANPETIEAPPDTPRGAVAKCGDGQFVDRWEDNTCFGKSGVLQRYSAPALGTGSDIVVKCGKRIIVGEWNKMSANQQAAFCGTYSEQPREPVACTRPSNVATADWNRMSADGQRAVCAPIIPDQPEQVEKPCRGIRGL